mgnify:CR=1 FL=1
MSINTHVPTPERVELPRIELCRDVYGKVSNRSGGRPGITSTNQLLDSMAPKIGRAHV